MPTNTFNYEIPKDQQSSAQYIEPSMTVDEAVAGRDWRAEKQGSVADQNAQNAQMIEGLGASQQPMNQQNITDPNQGAEAIGNVEGSSAALTQKQPQPLGSSNVTQLINSLTAGDQSGPTTLSVTSGLNGFNYKIGGQLSDSMYF